HGYPFGSLVPFVLDHAAQPVLLISRLAEHTRNIGADARVSLMVFEPGADVQAEARVTLVGDAEHVDADANLRARYLNYLPDADRLLGLGDFSFHCIRARMLRFIAGFSRIEWIDAAGYMAPEIGLAAQEAGILAHMNKDHAQTLREYCRIHHQRNVEHAV